MCSGDAKPSVSSARCNLSSRMMRQRSQCDKLVFDWAGKKPKLRPETSVVLLRCQMTFNQAVLAEGNLGRVPTSSASF